MKNLNKLFLAAFLLISVPSFASDGMAVIDMRVAVLSTQQAQDTFKALEEDADYAAKVEQAQTLQADRQALAETLQKDGETMSQEEVARSGKVSQFYSKMFFRLKPFLYLQFL